MHDHCAPAELVTTAKGAAIELTNLTLAYHRHPVVHHLSGVFLKSVATAIVGPNGAGKSSLLRALMGLLPSSEGHITLHGLEPKDIAYLPQQSSIDRSFPLTVLDVLNFGTWTRSGWFNKITQQHNHQIEHALEKVGLCGFNHRQIDELSVGQFQRVLFARLIIQDASLILLDEPFASLDQSTTDDLLGLVDEWVQQKRTVIAVLHDMQQVKQHFSQTLVLSREKIAWGRTDDVLTQASLLQATQRSLNWALHTEVCADQSTLQQEPRS